MPQSVKFAYNSHPQNAVLLVRLDTTPTRQYQSEQRTNEGYNATGLFSSISKSPGQASIDAPE